jgi:hypothetical protein
VPRGTLPGRDFKSESSSFTITIIESSVRVHQDYLGPASGAAGPRPRPRPCCPPSPTRRRESLSSSHVQVPRRHRHSGRRLSGQCRAMRARASSRVPSSGSGPAGRGWHLIEALCPSHVTSQWRRSAGPALSEPSLNPSGIITLLPSRLCQ